MGVVETTSGTRKHGDVAQSLAGTVAAKVGDLHVRQIGELSLRLYPQRQIKVLEVQKIPFVEAIDRLQRRRAEQHETATDDGNTGTGLLLGQVMHLVVGQAPVQHPSDAL